MARPESEFETNARLIFKTASIRPRISKPRVDSNVLPPSMNRSESFLSRLTPDSNLVVVKGDEIVHSLSGVKVPLLGRGEDD